MEGGLAMDTMWHVIGARELWNEVGVGYKCSDLYNTWYCLLNCWYYVNKCGTDLNIALELCLLSSVLLHWCR